MYTKNLDKYDLELLKIEEKKYLTECSNSDLLDPINQKGVVESWLRTLSMERVKLACYHFCNHCMLSEELNPECGAYQKEEARAVENSLKDMINKMNSTSNSLTSSASSK